MQIVQNKYNNQNIFYLIPRWVGGGQDKLVWTASLTPSEQCDKENSCISLELFFIIDTSSHSDSLK